MAAPLIQGELEFHILAVLIAKGVGHPYGVWKELKRRTTPIETHGNTVLAAFARLKKHGHIIECSSQPHRGKHGKRPRHSYSVTQSGASVYERKLVKWQEIVERIRGSIDRDFGKSEEEAI